MDRWGGRYGSRPPRKRTGGRFRFQFSLRTLLWLPLFLALAGSAYQVYKTMHPRRYPRIVIRRWEFPTNVYPSPVDTLEVQFGIAGGLEYYKDASPLGTVNEVIKPSGQVEYYRDWFVGTSWEESEVRRMPPELQERYRRLRAYVANRVDLDALPYDKPITLLLPADYPTFDEFLAEWRASHEPSEPP